MTTRKPPRRVPSRTPSVSERVSPAADADPFFDACAQCGCEIEGGGGDVCDACDDGPYCAACMERHTPCPALEAQYHLDDLERDDAGGEPTAEGLGEDRGDEENEP